MAVDWEEQLTVYFEQMGTVIITPTCREMLGLLKSSHLKTYAVVRDIRAEDFGADEWLCCAPDDIDPVTILIPVSNLSETSPLEVLRRLLFFEERVQEFYTCIAGRVTTRDQRDLFESLAKSKERHIYEIRSCLEYEGGT